MAGDTSSEARTEPGADRSPAANRDERDLVTAILAKNRKAAAQFVAAHVDAVYGYVRHRLVPRADLVDDVVQDVFVAALSSLRNYEGTSPLRAWLIGIARHKVDDVYRQRLREPEPLPDGDDRGAEPVATDPPDGPLLDLKRTKDACGRLCVFENMLTMLPASSGIPAMNPCRVCHARVLGERMEHAPIFWPGCPYSEFHRT